MNIEPDASIDALLEEIGENLKQRLKQTNLDQLDLAQLANLNRNTITSALSGNDIKLSTLIRITRVMSFSDWLLPLLAKPAPSPLEELGKRKKRIRMEKLKHKPHSREMGRSKDK